MAAATSAFSLLAGCSNPGKQGSSPDSRFETVLQWDTKTSESKEIDAIWLGYLMARAVYIGDHRRSYDLINNPPPLLDEEIEGRTKAAHIYKELGVKKGLRDPYFDDLLKVHLAGYMREYVWRNFRQKHWEEKTAPKNLHAFDSWAEKNIPKHQPVTHGAIVLKPR